MATKNSSTKSSVNGLSSSGVISAKSLKKSSSIATNTYDSIHLNETAKGKSKEEKTRISQMNKSIKNNSYASDMNTHGPELNQLVNKSKSKKEKVGNLVLDSAAININNSRVHQTRERRNNVVIIILIVLLLISIVYITLFALLYKPKQPNCHVVLSGNASDSTRVYVDGKQNTDWIATEGIVPGCEYTIDIKLYLTEYAKYNISYSVEVKYLGESIDFGWVVPAEEFADTEDGIKKYYQEYEGSGYLAIVKGVSFYGIDEHPEFQNINSNDLEINFYVKVDKI